MCERLEKLNERLALDEQGLAEDKAKRDKLAAELAVLEGGV
jgi:hypothetical protein